MKFIIKKAKCKNLKKNLRNKKRDWFLWKLLIKLTLIALKINFLKSLVTWKWGALIIWIDKKKNRWRNKQKINIRIK